jgi:ABC-type dipeptide/oligopeptide/nickel transport system permease subunit
MDENKEIIEEVIEASEAAPTEQDAIEESVCDSCDTVSDDEDISHVDTEAPLDKNVKLMSPTRMVLRRFFRSKLSIIGLCMVIGLFVFSFLGPLFYTDWGEIEVDERGKVTYASSTYEIVDDNGESIVIKQTTETNYKDNSLAPPSFSDPKGDGRAHPLGTDKQGYDVFVRLMYGGRISLTVSFLAVFVITLLGVILGGLAGYFGGSIDNLIMRVCDILMCLPGVPILLIISLILDSAGVDGKYKIYLLMIYLTLFSWPGTARLVEVRYSLFVSRSIWLRQRLWVIPYPERYSSTLFPTLCLSLSFR